MKFSILSFDGKNKIFELNLYEYRFPLTFSSVRFGSVNDQILENCLGIVFSTNGSRFFSEDLYREMAVRGFSFSPNSKKIDVYPAMEVTFETPQDITLYLLEESIVKTNYFYLYDRNQEFSKNKIVWLSTDEKVTNSNLNFYCYGNSLIYFNGNHLNSGYGARLVEAECKEKKNNGDFMVFVWDKPTDGISYQLSADGTYYICAGVGSATYTEIVVAHEYNGMPVKEIAANAFEGTSIVSIKIPPSVEKIGFSCFKNCNNLSHISAPFAGEEKNSITNVPISRWFGRNPTDTVSTNISSISIYEQIEGTESALYYGYAGLASLKTIHLPLKVPILNTGLFWTCRSVTSIMFYGSKRQFLELPKTSNWAIGLPLVSSVTCSDGEVDISEWKG